MPYVQRNFAGKITGTFANAQHGYAEELLPDDDPELVEFLSKQPHLSEESFKPPTEEQRRANESAQALSIEEGGQLRGLTLAYLHQWAELETAFSALFYCVVNTEPRSSKIPYAIYYALGGFDARINVVTQAVREFFSENPKLQCTAELWDAIREELRLVKNIRNQVAHGTILTIHSGGRQFTRLTSPPFDPIKVGRPLAKGPEVGLSPSQLRGHLQCLPIAGAAIDGMNRLISDFREFGDASVASRLTELDVLCGRLGSPRKAV